jgi:hypothetical protein
MSRRLAASKTSVASPVADPSAGAASPVADPSAGAAFRLPRHAIVVFQQC